MFFKSQPPPQIAQIEESRQNEQGVNQNEQVVHQDVQPMTNLRPDGKQSRFKIHRPVIVR